MAKEVDTDTKQKILEVASRLFAQKGFSGTSVRDIANTAGVNLAAINYHFSNKKNLLKEVIHNGYATLGEAIKNISNDNRYSFEELCPVVFDVMMNHGSMVVNGMRIMMSEDSNEIEEYESEDDFIGPPGGKVLFDVLTAEVGEAIPLEERFRAVHSIFNLIFHKAMILNSGVCANKPNLQEFLKPERVREDVKFVAKLLIDDLKRAQ